jgi:hypothetical protein
MRVEPWVVLIVAVLAVLILGAYGAAYLPALRSNRFWSGPKGEESIESKAARLHELVHPNGNGAEEGGLADESDGDQVQ